VWDVLPPTCVSPAQRVRINGTFSQESSLAYVAITRAARYLLATYAPPANARSPRPSPFFTFLERHPAASRDPNLLRMTEDGADTRLPPAARAETRTIRLTFSQLFTYWACPRQFYLRHILGYPPPLAEPLGYGKSLHSACWEVHTRVMAGEKLGEDELEAVAARHFHLPYAGVELTADLREAAIRALKAYVRGYHVEDGRIAYAEQEVRLDLGPLSVVGRIDLACVLEDGKIVLDELKTERAAREDQELLGPSAYGIAMQDTVGTLPGRVGTRPVVADGTAEYRSVAMDAARAEATRGRIRTAADAIARREFPMLPTGGQPTCVRCDVRRVCWRGQSKGKSSGDKGMGEIGQWRDGD
jgi:DNA helicase II / ATP-dependent DNA helicase PcrA